MVEVSSLCWHFASLLSRFCSKNEIQTFQLGPIILLLSWICIRYTYHQLWQFSSQFCTQLAVKQLEFDTEELIVYNRRIKEPFCILRSSRRCCMELQLAYFDSKAVVVGRTQLPLRPPPIHSHCFVLLQSHRTLTHLSTYVLIQDIDFQIWNFGRPLLKLLF